jgi:hypothetical protein
MGDNGCLPRTNGDVKTLGTKALHTVDPYAMVLPVAGPVAQLDRALPSEGRGRTFESYRVRQPFQALSSVASNLPCGLGSIWEASVGQ